MPFKDLIKNTTVSEPVGSATATQQIQITDLFADGYSEKSIRHAMVGEFVGGPYDYIINSFVNKLHKFEASCLEEMESGSPPKTQGELQDRIKTRYPEEFSTVLDKVVQKVVDGTGSFTDYENAISVKKTEDIELEITE